MILSRGEPPLILGSWSFPEVGHLLYCMQADHFQRRATSYTGKLTISRGGLPPILGRLSFQEVGHHFHYMGSWSYPEVGRATSYIAWKLIISRGGPPLLLGSWPFQEVGLPPILGSWSYPELSTLSYWEADHIQRWATSYIACKLIISRGLYSIVS